MKTFLRFLMFIFSLLATSSQVKAFTFNPNSHIQVYYDYCGRDVYVSFVWFQSEGDNDQMLWFYFNYKPASGPEQRIIDFRHLNYWPNDETGIDTLDGSSPYSSFGYKFPVISPNFNAQYQGTNVVSDNEGTKYWIYFKLNDLPPGMIETFTATGQWDGQGSGSPDYTINSTYPLQLVAPHAPTTLAATMDSCGFVRVSWENAETMACPGKEYYFRILKDNVFLADLFVPSIAQTDFYYTDYFNPINSLLPPNQHSYKVQLLLKEAGNGSIIQSSSFVGPVTGNPKLLPIAPGNLAVTYPDCNGAVNLTWTNNGLYDNIQVTLNPSSGTPVIYSLPGTATMKTGMITSGVTWSATVIGYDNCLQSATSLPLNGLAIPTGPGPLTLNTPIDSMGSIYLTWTASTGATSYDIKKTSADGEVTLTVSGTPLATSLLDSDIKTCTPYTYKVIAKNNCGGKASNTVNAPVIQSSSSIWSTQKLAGSKGYFENRVELTWDEPDNLAFDYFRMYRQPLGSSGNPSFVATIDKHDLKYIDETAQAGTIYAYTLKGYSECNGQSVETLPITDIGFRLPIAAVSGHVAYETGNGVEGVEISVERNAGSLGRSLYFDGQGALFLDPNYSSPPLQATPLNTNMTIDLWMLPENLDNSFIIFQYANGFKSYGLQYDANTNELVQYASTNNNKFTTRYSISLSTQIFNHLTWTYDQSSPNPLALYVNGIAQNGATISDAPVNGSIALTFGAQFTGWLDEIRIWDITRDTADIRQDYRQVLRGDEEHLISYFRIDEGIGSGVYDISGSGESFHGRHLLGNAHTSWNSIFPSATQLGYRTITDSTGNYIIRNINYTGTGNTFTVIPFFSPGGTPHEFEPSSTVIFLGEGNSIQNGLDFKDKSSFVVTGSIKYSLPDSMCDNTKVFFYIDDKLVLANNKPATVDPMTKTFTISVPIGLHSLSVAQPGHVFHHQGLFPPDGTLYDFQKDESGLEFFDSTRIRVIGRVVGGTREGDKKLGFGQSINNIGQAQITFTSQIFGCHQLTVMTDSVSGEYAVDLLPVIYDVSVTIPSNPGLDLGPQDPLNLAAIFSNNYEVDSVNNPGGDLLHLDSVLYNVKRNFIYRSDPHLDVTQLNGQPLKGDSLFTYVDPVTFDTSYVPLMDLPYPAFMAGKRYHTKVTAFEPYFNYDLNPPSEDRVPVMDGKITILNGLGNADAIGATYEEKLDLHSPEGKINYEFVGGAPDFFEDPDPNSNKDYTQTFQLQLVTPGHTTTWMPNGTLFRGYVFGSRPIAGASFITEGPELVDYILRDPPGDASTASFQSGEKYTTSKSWFNGTSVGLGGVFKFIVGTEYLLLTGEGFIVGYKEETESVTSLGLKATASFDAEGNYQETTEFQTEIKTSMDPFQSSDDNDIYVGKSINYLFGAADELTLVPSSLCNVIENCTGPELMINGQSFHLAKKKGLFMVPQGFKTTFVYSQFYIKTYLIPNIERIRNQLFVRKPNQYHSNLASDDANFGKNNDDPVFETMVSSATPDKTDEVDFNGVSYTYTVPNGESPSDSIRWYNQQIRLWRGAIYKNEEEKFKATLERNISFDANTSYNYTASSTNTDTYTEKFEVAVDINFEQVFNFEIAGNGGEIDITLDIVQKNGGAFTQETEKTNAYNYTLEDRQPGDFFSVDVKNGHRGNGPVFSLRGGQSMCPWEKGYETEFFNPGTQLSESTIRREWPLLDVEPNSATNVPSHQPAKFKLKMQNASPTGDEQWYGLRVLEDSNPYGAQLSIDGMPLTEESRIFDIKAGTTIEKTLLLHKADSDNYEIKIMLFSTCEYDAYQNSGNIYSSDTITISAHFVPACGPVTIYGPEDLFVNNAEDNSVIGIQLKDYDLSDPFLENLQLQYKPSFTSTWKGIQTLWKEVPNGSSDPQIPPGSSFMTYQWNIIELPDGPYDIRAVSHCTNTNNDYPSPTVSGTVDRIRPHAFGNPQPADGVLDPNDEILVQFNEEINPASVMTSDFDVRAVLNGSPLRHQTAVEFDGINDFIDVPTGARLTDEPFTWEAWIKRNGSGAQLLWSQGEKSDSTMEIGFNLSNQLFFRWDNSLITSTSFITNDGNWHHIAVSCNANKQVRFYDTGVEKGGGFVTDMVQIPGEMVYGQAAWTNASFFKGDMHEARIWRTELTIGAIQSQMLKRLSGAEPGLAMLWPMDEGMGVTLREIVRKRNATMNGTWSVLPSGKAYAFTISDYLKVSAGTMVFDQQHSFTLEFWLKADKTANYQTLLSNGKGDGTDGNDSGWSISADPNGNLWIDHGGQQFEVIEKDILNNNWHHVAIVVNRQGNLNTYLDGTLETSIYGNAIGDFGGAYLWIGSRGWYNGAIETHDRYFNGALDEIRVWNSRLTSENIKANMNNRLAGDEFGLLLYLPFETYTEIGGIPVLTASLADGSPFMRTVVVEGDPFFQDEDPNIKLVAPFEKVNFTYSINGDKIIITPTTDPVRIEKTVLYISLQHVQDLHGNEMAGPINWTAYVNKNQLQWVQDELAFDKPEKEPFEFTAEILNSGGIELSYEILGLPEWLTVIPAVGTISPVSKKTLHFTIAADVAIGDYSADINLLSGQGFNDKLALNLHVFGVPPDWAINPNAYSNSMSVVADLDIKGNLSNDPLDRVVAYVNGQVRGLATMTYVPSMDKYLAFMNIYSNVASNETITFKVWDASTGVTYAGVNLKVGAATNSQIPFVANSLVGNVVTPAHFIVTNDIIQEIPMNAGWTWISFNVNSAKFNNLNAFFAELKFENNDLVISQTKSAAYNPSTGWQGNLVNIGLEYKKMYECNFTHPDILRVVGPRVNPALNPITIVNGWNWIPMLSSTSIPINQALNTFVASAGDIVKSQDQVAVYHPSQGWIGTLQFLEPGKGYLLYAGNTGSIIYPFSALPGPEHYDVDHSQTASIDWRSGSKPDVIEHQQQNMTIIARFDCELSFDAPVRIAAMASGHLLQLEEAIPFNENGIDYYYFTLQGYEGIGPVYFEIYSASGDYMGLA
ncbi:MAG TPA: LamG domain-containing protein [Saprospiraceae bacterium]|nr:LamG domain-containing protein [Saprospiraceae bacterium]